MRRIIASVCDKDSFFEMGALFGRSIITGFARLDGWPVAVMAGDPLFDGGAWTADACSKIIRFVDMAQTFHLPIVHLVDCPGFQVGLRAESTAVIRWGVRALAAINQTTVPVVQHHRAQLLRRRRPRPSAGRASVPALRLALGQLGIAAAGGRHRGGLSRRNRRRSRTRTRSWRRSRSGWNRLRSPYRTAEAFWVEEVIDPRDTRKLLCDFANLAAPLRTPGPSAFGMRP